MAPPGAHRLTLQLHQMDPTLELHLEPTGPHWSFPSMPQAHIFTTWTQAHSAAPARAHRPSVQLPQMDTGPHSSSP